MRSYIKEILNKKLADNVAIYEILKVVNEKYFTGKFEDLSEGEKVVFLVGILDGEVNNGGFDQYFFNNGIKFADITISNLDIIGADYTAELLKEALYIHCEAIYKYGIDKRLVSYDENQKNKLSELDSSYYMCFDNLLELQLKYVQKNIDKF